jgi:hypothetical protein
MVTSEFNWIKRLLMSMSRRNNNNKFNNNNNLKNNNCRLHHQNLNNNRIKKKRSNLGLRLSGENKNHFINCHSQAQRPSFRLLRKMQ